MVRGQLRTLMRHIQRIASPPEFGEWTDRQLLARFARCHDEAAFATLVRRHGPLVLGACGRVLHHSQDAEDVFQATFLVLARKAGSVRWRESVAGWLYEVAYRLARRAKADAGRWRSHEQLRAGQRPQVDAEPKESWRQLCVLLDEELQRLPAKLRTPLLLCYLDGQTRDQAARQLGWSRRTLQRRLEQGLERLRDRLGRRGVPLSAALLTAALLERPASAAVAPMLVSSTIEGAVRFAAGQAVAEGMSSSVALAEGVLSAMTVTRKVLTAWAVAAGLALAGVGVLAYQPGPGQPMAAPAGDGLQPAAKENRPPGPTHEPRAGTDRFGDPLPAGALARIGTLRLRHGDGVRAIVFSSDGRSIISGSGPFDPTIRFWDARDGREERRLQVFPGFPSVDAGVMALALSPDGKRLASASSGTRGHLDLWETATGRHLSRAGHPQGIYAVAFSPDGRALASGGYDQTIRLWEAATGKELRQFKGHGGVIQFSPDGKTLASASADQTIRFVDVATDKENRTLRGTQSSIRSLAFDRTGNVLASAGKDRTVRLWDVATGRELRRFAGHEEDISAVAFSPKDGLLASASRDRTVRLWDRDTGRELRKLTTSRLDFSSLAFSPDGNRLVAGSFDNGICLWDVANGKELLPFPGHKGWVLSLRFSPDGATLFSGSVDGTIRISDPRTGQERRVLATDQGWVKGLALSPDGRMIAAANYGNTVGLWDVASGKELGRFAGHTNGVTAVAFSRDGKALASGSQDRTVRLWDSATGQELRVLAGPKAEVQSVAFSPDGRTVAVGGGFRDEAVYLWETATGKQLRRLTGHSHAIGSLAFTPDGRTLVSASVDHSIRIWDVATGNPPRLCKGPDQGSLSGFNYMALSADGRFLVSAGQDHVVRIWEVATGQQVCAFTGHQGEPYAVAFALDGRTVASGGRDGTVLVWGARGSAAGKETQLGPAEWKTLWTDLAQGDAARAYRALWALVAAPEKSLPFLREHLQPVPAVDEQRLARLIADLDSDRFAVRQQAAAELEKLGRPAEPALRKALAGKPSAEVRRRAEAMLAKFDGEDLRTGRALAALERIGTPAARAVLQGLARGAAGIRLTEEATAAVERLDRRTGTKP